jgi:hypothetical protein
VALPDEVFDGENVRVSDVANVGEVIQVCGVADDEGSLPFGDAALDCGDQLVVAWAEDDGGPERACQEFWWVVSFED